MNKKNKLTVMVGEAFSSLEIEPEKNNNVSAETINAAAKANEGSTRTYISYAIVGTTIIFLLGSAIVSLLVGSFGPLIAIWSVVGPLVGALTGYYYKMAGD